MGIFNQLKTQGKIIMRNLTAIQRRNGRMHAMFDYARKQDEESKKIPLEYAAGTIGNARRGVVAMLSRGAWGYSDETGNLLAAAPELFEACSLAAVRLESGTAKEIEFNAPLAARLRRALAKAKGAA